MKDIKTAYTKEQNKENGRKGYGAWKNEKEYNISPDRYGMFLEKHKHRKH